MKSVAAVAMVMEVLPQCGRLLIAENVLDPELVVFFDLNTTLNGQPISQLSSNAQNVVYPGMCVDITFQVSTANLDANGIVRCISMVTFDKHCHNNSTVKQSNEHQTPYDGFKEESAMVISVHSSGCGTGMTAQSEMLVLHSQSLPHDELMTAIAAYSNSPTPSTLHHLNQIKPMSLKNSNLMSPGRVVLVRAAAIPAWMREISSEFKLAHSIALTVRSNGDTDKGVGTIVKFLENGGLLQPIHSNRRQDLIYFALNFLPKTKGGDLKTAWPLDSCLLYEACRELPGRMYQWRAFRLTDMDEPTTAPTTDSLPVVLKQVATTSTSEIPGVLPVASNCSLETNKSSLRGNDSIRPESSSSSSLSPSSVVAEPLTPSPTPLKRQRLKTRSYAADRLAYSDQSKSDSDEENATSSGTNSAPLVVTSCTQIPTITTLCNTETISISQGVDLFASLLANATVPDFQAPVSSSAQQVSKLQQQAIGEADDDDDLTNFKIADHKDKVPVVGASGRCELITRDQLKKLEGNSAVEKQKKPLPVVSINDPVDSSSQKTKMVKELDESTRPLPTKLEMSAKDRSLISDCAHSSADAKKSALGALLESDLSLSPTELEMLKLLAPKSMAFLGL